MRAPVKPIIRKMPLVIWLPNSFPAGLRAGEKTRRGWVLSCLYYCCCCCSHEDHFFFLGFPSYFLLPFDFLSSELMVMVPGFLFPTDCDNKPQQFLPCFVFF